MARTISLIGLGGIGGAVARALPLTLAWLNQVGTRYVVNLVDGDTFEPHNAHRQIFHRAGPKATVTAEALGRDYQPDSQNRLPPISFRPFVEYVTAQNVASFVIGTDVVLLAVDDHHPRRLVSECAAGQSDVVVISGSNNQLTSGTVQLYARSRGRDVTLPLHNEHHPEIADAGRQWLFGPGCDMQFGAVGNEQLYVVNNRVAATMMELLHMVLTADSKTVASWPDEVRLDTAHLAQRAVTLRQI